MVSIIFAGYFLFYLCNKYVSGNREAQLVFYFLLGSGLL